MKHIRCRFTMMELVFALALLFMVTSLFYRGYGVLQNTHRRIALEGQAIQVLDNVLERLAFAKDPGFKTAQAIFADEYAKGFPEPIDGVSGTCEIRNGTVVMAISGQGRRPLAIVTVAASGDGS
jgi:hypothetical protein